MTHYKRRSRKKETYVIIPAKYLFLVYFLIAGIFLFYPLLDLSCGQQVANGNSKAEALYGSTCTIRLNNIILFWIGIFVFVVGFIYAKEKPF